MKKARHKRSHVVEFHLYEIPRIGKFIEAESGWKEREMEGDCLIGMG